MLCRLNLMLLLGASLWHHINNKYPRNNGIYHESFRHCLIFSNKKAASIHSSKRIAGEIYC